MRYSRLMALILVTVGTISATRAAPNAADAVSTNDWVMLAQRAAAAGDEAASPAGDEVQIARALLEALRFATDSVVAEIGRPGGFLDDPAIRIPLPGGLENLRGGLMGAGLGPLVEDLEQRMNRAAEQAVPELRPTLREALADTTIEDARGLLAGADDSATQYFAARMQPFLAERMAPIVDDTLREVGAIQAFDAFVAQYATLPLMPDIRDGLTDHVVAGTLDGFFFYMAQEERTIRNDPAARTTALMRAVFGETVR